MKQAFALAYKANRTSVVAMGNHQLTQPNLVAFPAGFDNVIAVGATNIFDNIANFSVHGNHIDVSAPGVDILSTFTGGGYGNQSGTSMATPHVSGIASLLRGFNNNLANDDIENLIRLSADDLNNPGSGDGTGPGIDASSGAGRVNAERALNFLIAPSTLNQWTVTGGTITSSTNDYSIQFYTVPGLAAGNYIAKRHEVRSSVTFPTSFCQLTGVWGRGVSSVGWSLANPNYGEGFCEVVPGTLTNSGAILRTYIYEVKNTLGQFLGWYPTTASNVMFAYTALGVPNPANVNITGPDVVCTTGTYTINNVPPDYSFSWSTSSHLGIQSNSGNSVTVNKLFNGNGWVRATLTGNGCSIPITKNIQVGPTTANFSISSYPSCGSPGDVITFVAEISGVNYSWTVNGGALLGGQGTQSIYASMNSSNMAVHCYVTGQNATNCFSPEGISSSYIGQCYEYSALSTSPNPASNSLTIELDEPEENKPVGIELRNNFGKPVKSFIAYNNRFEINTESLPKGLYILKVTYDGQIFNRRILIEK